MNTSIKKRNMLVQILFILWLFFSPAVWFLVQRDLNKFAESAAVV